VGDARTLHHKIEEFSHLSLNPFEVLHLCRPHSFDDLADLLDSGVVGFDKDMREWVFAEVAHRGYMGRTVGRSEYWHIGDHFLNRDNKHIHHAVWELSYFTKRMDVRSCGRIWTTFHDNTVREKVVLRRWLEGLVRAGLIAGYKIDWKGTDHTGSVVLWPRKATDEADAVVTVWGSRLAFLPDGENVLEVKFNPGTEKFTFKVCDLDAYDRQKALMLCVSMRGKYRQLGPNGKLTGPSYKFSDDEAVWSLFTPDCMRHMLDTLPHQCYEEVGWKLGVQVDESQIGKYFLLENMGECTQRDGLARPWEDNK